MKMKNINSVKLKNRNMKTNIEKMNVEIKMMNSTIDQKFKKLN